MNRFRVYIVLLILLAVASCGNIKEFEPEPSIYFYQDVYGVSDNVRDVSVGESDDGQIRIRVCVYSEYLEYDYEEFCDRVVEIASDYNLNENGYYIVTIYDMNTYLQDMNSPQDSEYQGGYYGEYYKEYDKTID